MAEQATHEVDIERARDRLPQEERIGRRGLSSVKRLPGEVMPRRVRDYVGRDVVVDQDVTAAVAAPEGEVERESVIPPSSLSVGQDPERVPVATEHLLQLGVEPHVSKRRLVLDVQLVDRLDHEGRRRARGHAKRRRSPSSTGTFGAYPSSFRAREMSATDSAMSPARTHFMLHHELSPDRAADHLHEVVQRSSSPRAPR